MINKPRGTKDIFGFDELIYKKIFNTFEKLANSYNIKKIITPTFESYDLFKKSTGDSSDIVTKEIYKFKDQGNRELALKPEGTASVGRAILENKLYLSKEYNKLYYIDSMFRYERPQKGRLRQFYQIGVEFTNELSDSVIVDAIVLASSFLEKLNINDYTLHINSIGLEKEREKYISKLKEYFKKNKNELSELSKSRIDKNPLRILDDKVDSKLNIVKECPKICEFWSNETKNQFENILKTLDHLKIKYEIDYSLVRGLDYYSNIVFEFISNSETLGSKTTIIGGGCYLDLIKDKDNNKKINGVGFGIGVERIFEILKSNKKDENFQTNIDVYFLIENDKQYLDIIKTIYSLRSNNVKVEFNYIPKKFKKIWEEIKKIETKLLVFQELKQHGSKKWTIKHNKINSEIDIKHLEKEILEKIK